MSQLSALKWRLTASYVIIAFVAIGALALSLSLWTDAVYRDQLTSRLRAEARLIARDLPRSKGQVALQKTASEAGRVLETRVTIISAKGVVLADNQHNPKTMANHGSRPEFQQAMREGQGTAMRFSRTLHTRMLYVALPYGNRDGVVRLAVPLTEIERLRGAAHRAAVWLGLVAAVVLAWVSTRISRSVTLPISQMSKFAADFSHGKAKRRIYAGKGAPSEISVLSKSLNEMADRLQETLDQLAEEKNKAEAVLWKINDGVIVLDSEGRIRLANSAAQTILGVEADRLQGKTVIEGTFNTELSELAGRALRSGEPATLDVTLSRPAHRDLSVHAAPMEDAVGQVIGAVLVLRDFTAERDVHRIRRDFVANVSHELRTPLASLKAMAETILLRGGDNPTLSEEYATKMSEEIDRLALMTQELLGLAEIENGTRTPNKRQVSLPDAVEDAITAVLPLAERKGISIAADIPPELAACADPDGLKQVLVNLLDNAVKYTGEGGSVTISAEETPSGVAISVRDTGIGISPDDCRRIFERFYRVDKDRSRATGGTGLGLSIVRHIVESHGGKVTVESELGRGSRFAVFFPAR